MSWNVHFYAVHPRIFVYRIDQAQQGSINETKQLTIVESTKHLNVKSHIQNLQVIWTFEE